MRVPRIAIVCFVTAILGLGLATIHLAFGSSWVALWAGLGLFYVAGTERPPRFFGRPPPASLTSLQIDDRELEGFPGVPRWVAGIVATLCVITGLAPVMAPSQVPAAACGVPTAIVLLGSLAWLRGRDRANITPARTLLSPPSGRSRWSGTVQTPDQPLLRQIFWFDITGTRTQTQTVETIHGQLADVQTTTATSTTYGFSQTQARNFTLSTEQGPVKVAAGDLVWAGVQQPLPTAPELRLGSGGGAKDLVRAAVVPAYVGQARQWEEERVQRGHSVVIVGVVDAKTGRITSTSSVPALAFATGPGSDPLAVLGATLARRGRMTGAIVGLVGLVLALSIVG